MGDTPPLVLVGVTGGVAAYKTCEIVRRLVEAGRDVRCALTPDAARFIGPQLLARAHAQARARRPPGARRQLPAPRRRARRRRRLHRAVHGQHAREAGRRPGRQRRHAERALDARAAARRAGDERAHVAPPGDAGQRRAPARARASCSSGPPRARSPRASRAWAGWPSRAEIVAAIEALLAPATGPLAGRRVLVTAGGTREPLDGVRFLGNRSSGGWASRSPPRRAPRGAEVVTLLANAAVRPESGVVVEVETTEELRARGARARRVGRRRADGGGRGRLPARRRLQAGKRERGGAWSLELEPTADVLAALGRTPPAGPGARRLRGRGRRRRRARRGQAGAQGRRPDRAQRRLAQRHRLRRRRQRGRARRAPTARTHVPRAPKRVIAGAVLDRVQQLLS